MLSVFTFLISFLLSLSTVSSSALPSSSNLVSSSPNTPSVSQLLGTNDTNLQDLASPELSYNPECSPQYGRDLDHDSCNNALAKVSRVTTPMTFGERGTGTWDVILPRRYLSDDGLCAIDVTIDPDGAQRDVSNYLQLTVAASAVLRACVTIEERNSGGLVKGLGIRYRSLSVEVRQITPDVTCHDQLTSTPPSYTSCKEVLDTLPWSQTLMQFGLPWQPGVQVELPYFLISADRQCKLLLANKIPAESVSPVETSSWDKVWAAAVAINEMCVQRGEGGSATPPSRYGGLMVFFFGPGRGPPLEVLSGLNISASDLSVLSAPNSTLAGFNSTASVTDA